MTRKVSYCFVTTAILIIVAGFLDNLINKGNAIFDVNIHDTYFVAARVHIAVFISIIYALLGAGYWLFDKLRLCLNKPLTATHAFVTIGGVVLYWMFFLYSFVRKEKPYDFMSLSNDEFLNIRVLRIVVLVTLIQPLYIINIIVGIAKRNKI